MERQGNNYCMCINNIKNRRALLSSSQQTCFICTHHCCIFHMSSLCRYSTFSFLLLISCDNLHAFASHASVAQWRMSRLDIVSCFVCHVGQTRRHQHENHCHDLVMIKCKAIRMNVSFKIFFSFCFCLWCKIISLSWKGQNREWEYDVKLRFFLQIGWVRKQKTLFSK